MNKNKNKIKPKTFTILFDDNPCGLTTHIGLIMRYVEPRNSYFAGFWGNSLKQVYEKYLKHTGKWYPNSCIELHFDKLGDMYYEISEQELLDLIKLEKLTGGL